MPSCDFLFLKISGSQPCLYTAITKKNVKTKTSDIHAWRACLIGLGSGPGFVEVLYVFQMCNWDLEPPVQIMRTQQNTMSLFYEQPSSNSTTLMPAVKVQNL